MREEGKVRKAGRGAEGSRGQVRQGRVAGLGKETRKAKQNRVREKRKEGREIQAEGKARRIREAE